MTMRVFSVQHHRQGLAEVERTAAGAPSIAERMAAHPEVSGVVVLSTCNRVEVLLDTTGDVPHTALRTELNSGFDAPPSWDLFLGEAALTHVFRVAAGLEAMVVGEREIAGQLRRAQQDAVQAGRSSLPLNIAVDEALRASRRVARETSLEGNGRSVVSSGLDRFTDLDWAQSSFAVVGTGAYAGAVVAALRARGATKISVHSASGRGAAFAESHGVGHVRSIREALEADLVIACRGLGSTVVHASDVTAPARFLDLSLQRDIDPEVDSMPGVHVVDLADIQRSVGPAYAEDASRAEEIVAAGVGEALTKLRARIVDPVVAGLRETVMDMVADEVARLPKRDLTHEDAAHALRRLATRLLHIPSSRARVAAEEGRTDAYLLAMAELYGIGDVPVDPNEMETAQCPVTHMRVCDLSPQRSRR